MTPERRLEIWKLCTRLLEIANTKTGTEWKYWWKHFKKLSDLMEKHSYEV